MTEPAHLKRGPSGAHQWLICTDSPEAQEPYPDETTDAADEGTAAHWLLEQCLGLGMSAEEAQLKFDGVVPRGAGANPDHGYPGTLKEWPITGEMVEAVQTHIDTVNKHATKRGTKTFIEERVHVGEHYGLKDRVGGTADTIMWLPKSKTLCIYDFKYGKGHVVEVGSNKWTINPQIGLYAIAALCDLVRLLGKKVEVRWIELAIIQPRAYHKKGPVRMKKISPMQLMDLEAAMIEAVNGPRVRVAGEHCHFCRAKPDCAEYHAYRGEAATSGFGAEMPEEITGDNEPNPHRHEIVAAPPLMPMLDLINRPVKGLSLNELAMARQVLGPLKGWMSEIEEEIRTRWLNDLPVPGTKLVQGPGSRAYGGSDTDIHEALAATAEELGIPEEELMEPAKLKTPAQLEKQLGKAKFKATSLAKLVAYTAGGPVVVDESSDKPAYVKDGGFKAEVPQESTEHPLL